MAAIRESYWVRRLRQLVKVVTRDCCGCKRFQETTLAAPPPALLPRSRTEGSAASEVIGVDSAGPIRYRQEANREGKAYITLFVCSLTHAVRLKLLPSLEKEVHPMPGTASRKTWMSQKDILGQWRNVYEGSKVA